MPVRGLSSPSALVGDPCSKKEKARARKSTGLFCFYRSALARQADDGALAPRISAAELLAGLLVQDDGLHGTNIQFASDVHGVAELPKRGDDVRGKTGLRSDCTAGRGDRDAGRVNRVLHAH